MFPLCGARPYVSIVWGYWLAVGVGLGHMFLLVGCGRGAGPYVCIGWLWAICFYYVGLWTICFYCMCGPYVFIGDCYESYHMLSLTMEPSTGHLVKYYKYGFTWKLSDYMYAFC